MANAPVDILDSGPERSIFRRTLFPEKKGHIFGLTFLLFLLGLIPLILAWHIGAYNDIVFTVINPNDVVNIYTAKGYGSRANWLSLVVFLPLSYYLLIYIAGALYGIGGSVPSSNYTRVLEGRVDTREFNKELCGILWEPRYLAILVIVFAIPVLVSLWWIDDYYFSDFCGNLNNESSDNKYSIMDDLDWSVFFLLSECISTLSPDMKLSPGQAVPESSKFINAILVMFAYFVQFMTLFFSFYTLFILIFGYKLFLLSRIYQRRRQNKKASIVIDFDDQQHACLGLHPLYKPIRLQIVFTLIFGIALLISRYSNVTADHSRILLKIFDLSTLLSFKIETYLDGFGEVGFWGSIGLFFKYPPSLLPALVWLVLLSILWMPILIKFLPILQRKFWTHWRSGGYAYICEFSPLQNNSIKNIDVDNERVEKMLERFSHSSFSPFSDRKAQLIMILQFFMLLMLIFPFKVSANNITTLLVLLLLFLIISVYATRLFFKTLRQVLSYYDERLGRSPK